MNKIMEKEDLNNIRLVDINNWLLLVAIKVPSGIWCFIGYDKKKKDFIYYEKDKMLS